MSQQDSLNMKVVVLAVICVILLASTIGAFVLYIPAQTQIDEKNQIITSLNQQISDLQAQLNAVPDNSDLQSQIDSLKNTNLNLQDQWNQMNATMYEYVEAYNNQQKYIDLKAYGTLYNNGTTLDANSTITLWTGTINYAGYVLIDATSNTTSTYAQKFTFSQKERKQAKIILSQVEQEPMADEQAELKKSIENILSGLGVADQVKKVNEVKKSEDVRRPMNDMNEIQKSLDFIKQGLGISVQDNRPVGNSNESVHKSLSDALVALVNNK